MLDIKDSRSIVEKDKFGGKAHWLSWLQANGYNIPPALFLPIDFQNSSIDDPKFSEIVEAFLQENDNSFSRIYAVRSSSVLEDDFYNSNAGVFTSKLRIKDIHQIIRSIPEIRGEEHHTKDGIGVIIQPYIEAAFSGVIFSTHPTKETRNEIMVEYIEGNSEKLLDGSRVGKKIELDLTSDDWNHIECDFAIETFKELVRIAKEIETTVLYPVDIEWCIQKDTKELFLLQCRPITHIIDMDPQLINIGKSHIEAIPSEVLNNEKVQLRVNCKKNGVNITNAFLLKISEQDFQEGRLNRIVEQIIPNEFTVGLSCILIHPKTINGKIMRSFADNSQASIVDNIEDILIHCFESYWQVIIIIQELYDMKYMGIIRKISSDFLIEISYGGFIQKGLTEVSQYLISDDYEVLKKDERIQQCQYNIESGVVVKRSIQKEISFSQDQLMKIISSFKPILNDASTVEFGISKSIETFLPYLIDISADTSSIDTHDVYEGIISKGKRKGILRTLNIDDEEWQKNVEKHFLDNYESSISTESSNIIFLVSQPHMTLINILNEFKNSKIGFIFEQASILSHLCILLRERGIPSLIIPNGNRDELVDGVTISMDTITPNLSNNERVILFNQIE